MKTYMANPDKIERKWYVVDAEGATLGRLASEIAKVLRGKNKPEYTPHIDTGDYVIVVNAEKVKVTGKKLQQKIYYNHSSAAPWRCPVQGRTPRARWRCWRVWCPWRRRSPFQTPPRAVCAATANRPRLRPRCRSR